MSETTETKNVKLISNKNEVLKACAEQIYLGLASIGEEAEGHAKSECPVNTGRLRNSITYATQRNTGSGTDNPQSNPEEFTLYIGTNVEYAAAVEYSDNKKHTNGKAHYLRDSIATHTDRYINILKAALEAGKT